MLLQLFVFFRTIINSSDLVVKEGGIGLTNVGPNRKFLSFSIWEDKGC